MKGRFKDAKKNWTRFFEIYLFFYDNMIHIPFPEPIGTIITPLTRVAVPIFLMITGYFYSMTKQNNSEVK